MRFIDRLTQLQNHITNLKKAGRLSEEEEKGLLNITYELEIEHYEDVDIAKAEASFWEMDI